MSGEYDVEGVEDELVRALRSPGTAAELAEEADYRTMFRAESAESAGSGGPAPGTLRRAGATTARRLGAGGALAVTLALASAGVAAAAAYSNHLPDPVQQVVHQLLAPIGVPPAQPTERAEGRRTTARPGAPGPKATTAPTPSGTSPSATTGPEAPRPSSGAPGHGGTGDGAGEGAGPTSSSPRPADAAAPPAATSGPQPTSDPTPVVTPRVKPAAVSIVAAGHLVGPGAVTQFAGVVTGADGAGLEGRRVALQRRTPDGWRLVAAGRSSADGSVSLSTAPADQTARYRLRILRVHSAPWRLALHPTLTVSGSLDRRAGSITATVTGGQAGDRVLLLRRRAHQPVVVAETALGPNGQAVFSVQQRRARLRYVVVLLRTPAHTAVRAPVLLTRAARVGAPDPEAEPSSSP